MSALNLIFWCFTILHGTLLLNLRPREGGCLCPFTEFFGVDAISLSWENQNHTWRRLQSASKFTLALKECIAQSHKDFVFTAHCDALFFAPHI
jgi:hypothetical protein